VYGSTNSTFALDTAGIQQRVQAEAKDLDPKLLQITSAAGNDSAGNPCIDVTVTYPFKMITNYLISTNLNVVSRIRMPVGPRLPLLN